MDYTQAQNQSTGQVPPFEMAQTVSKTLYDEVVKQNRQIGGNNQKLCDHNDELQEWVKSVKAEGDRILDQNEKLQRNLEEANQKFKKEEIKRINAETELRKFANVESRSKEVLSLKKGNKSQVEQLEKKLDGANAQIDQLNSQLNASSEMLKSSSDENKKLSEQLKQMEVEKNRLATYVSGLKEDNEELQKFRHETTSQTANELVSEREQLKEELEKEKKRSSVLERTVQSQSEKLKKLNPPYTEVRKELKEKNKLHSKLQKRLGNAKDEVASTSSVVYQRKSCQSPSLSEGNCKVPERRDHKADCSKNDDNASLRK
ncbi:unnamed protein product [Orchesella dallaii]|uniref:Uncharacterized protein n=1 Tax=Orchesella dallaii TaxID=48710 RepID=A0ABP1R4C1_9HEXA